MPTTAYAASAACFTCAGELRLEVGQVVACRPRCRPLHPRRARRTSGSSTSAQQRGAAPRSSSSASSAVGELDDGAGPDHQRLGGVGLVVEPSKDSWPVVAGSSARSSRCR